MYHTVAASQQVLNKICTAVNSLQAQVQEIRSDIDAVQRREQPGARTPASTTTQMDLSKELESLAREVAAMRMVSQQQQQQQHVVALDDKVAVAMVRKECDAAFKKQHDLLEALLTAKCEKMVARCVQEACDVQRRELVCKVESACQDVVATLEPRIKEAATLEPRIKEATTMCSQLQAAQFQLAAQLSSQLLLPSQSANISSCSSMTPATKPTDVSDGHPPTETTSASDSPEADRVELVVSKKAAARASGRSGKSAAR